MALYQYQNFGISVWGDGSSTTLTVDLADQIRALTTLPKYPSTILHIDPLGSITVTGTLEGTLVHLTFSSAPGTNTQNSLNVILGF